MLTCHRMKSNALLLTALVMSPLTALAQDAQVIFDALPSPAREMQIASAQEIYSTRAPIPAGDYELIADVRELPALLQLFAASGAPIDLEGATLVSSKGNLSELKEYAPIIVLLQLIEKKREQIEKQIKSAAQRQSNDALLNELKREEALLLTKMAMQLVHLPAFSVKPAYLSLHFTQPHVVAAIMASAASAPPAAAKPLRVGEAVGYELGSSDLPDVLQQKLRGTPTLFFYPVDAHRMVIALGTGTEALDKLAGGGARMSDSSVTVPRTLKAQLWVDASVTQPFSTQTAQNLKKTVECFDSERDGVGKLMVQRNISSGSTMMPQFSEGIEMQVWMQDGDLVGSLSTATRNYQLGSAPPLAVHLAAQPEIDFYGEVSPLPQSKLAALTELHLNRDIQLVWLLNSMAMRYVSAKSDASHIEAEFLAGYEKVMSTVLPLLPSMTGNIGIAERESRFGKKHPQYERPHRILFAGVKDKVKLAADFGAALEALSGLGSHEEPLRKNIQDDILKLSTKEGASGSYFRAGSKLIAFGNDVENAEALVAHEHVFAPPAMSGARLMWRGALLQKKLPPSLREKIEGFYLRLDSAGEKKDIYFKLDMK